MPANLENSAGAIGLEKVSFHPNPKGKAMPKRSNQPILKEISPKYSLEGLMLKLKLQYFAHLMRRTDLLEKTMMQERLRVGGEEDERGWDGWMASPTGWT